MDFESIRVGDRVMLDWDRLGMVDGGPSFYEGITGTVVNLIDADTIGVSWDFEAADDACHSCDHHCPNGYGWFVPCQALLPLEEVPSIDPAGILALLMGGE